jgi:uncharacterized Tic20 family protein
MMSAEISVAQEERTWAGIAHGSILLAPFTSGLGGIVAALVIWALQKEKSAWVADQALQALVYQALAFLLTTVAWCCWGVLWTLLILVPIAGDPAAYETTLPAGFWVGLALLIVPLGLWALTILYGLWAAVRSFGGHDFKYVIIGQWLDRQQITPAG